MSKFTAIRKQGGNGSGWFLSIDDMNRIRAGKDIDWAQTKRRQKAYDASPRRKKDGTPYKAHCMSDLIQRY